MHRNRILLLTCGLTVLAIGASAQADNRYCGPGDVPGFGASDGPAAMPSRCVYTGMPDISGYTVKTVCHAADGACDYTTVGAAMAAAACGSIIKIKARDASGKQIAYDEQNLQITKACDAAHWIVVASDLFQDSNFPTEGTRITPAWVGVSSLIGRPPYAQPNQAGTYIPKIRANPVNSQVFQMAGGSYWRLIGLEITGSATASRGFLIGPVPQTKGTLQGDHIFFDRLIVHGGDSLAVPGPTGLGENSVDGNGITAGQTTHLAVIDSYVFDLICAKSCTDSHAISFGGNDPAVQEGPTKVVNNFLEASGENIFAGGGGTGAGCCTIPTDLEIRRNYRFKPAKIWQVSWPDANKSATCNHGKDVGCDDNPDYVAGLGSLGIRPIVKNLGEFKSGSRILIEGDVADTNWGGQSDQFGHIGGFNPVSQSKHYNGCASADGTGNIWSDNCAPGINGKPIVFDPDVVDPNCANDGHCGVYPGSKADYKNNWTAQTFVSPSRIVVAAGGISLSSFTGQMVTACEPGLNPLAASTDIVVRFNILRHAAGGMEFHTYKSVCLDKGKEMGRVSFHDNQLDDIDGWKWNLKAGACCSWGMGVLVGNDHADQATATHDVSIAHNTILVAQENNAGTEGAVKFFNNCGPTCTATIPNLTIRDNLGGGGMEDNAGVSRDPCNASKQDSPAGTLLNCLTAGAFGGGTASWCMTGNAFSNGTVPTYPAPQTNTPFPPDPNGSMTSPACPPGVNTFNFNPADYTSFGFKSLNNANGGDYHLLASSPYHNAASDGKDIGADIDAINSHMSGVTGGDTTPPTVAISAPTNGATVSGSITVSGTAADNVAVAKVDVAVDGGAYAPASGTTSWTFGLDTRSLANGSHTITARAMDSSGNTATASVSVTVNNSIKDTTPPTVAISNPANGATVSGTITVSGTAADNVAVSSVALSIDGGAPTLASGTTSWTFLLDTTALSDGTHTVKAMATDPTGNTGSTSISIGIDNTPPALSAIAASSISTFSATISWTTDEPATSKVDYGTTTSYGQSTALDQNLVTAHSVLLSGLLASTTYHFRVRSKDGLGNQGVSKDNIFRTATPDLIPPSVAISTPIDGSKVGRGPVPIAASAADNVAVAHVQFLVDGALISDAAAPPYAAIWDASGTKALSKHVITTIAFDTSGNQSSASVTITMKWAKVAPNAEVPGLRTSYVYPSPAGPGQTPTIRAALGLVDSVEITIFDISGRVVHSDSIGGSPTGVDASGEYYYDLPWAGNVPSGVYSYVVHGKTADGTIVRARGRFAVVH